MQISPECVALSQPQILQELSENVASVEHIPQVHLYSALSEIGMHGRIEELDIFPPPWEFRNKLRRGPLSSFWLVQPDGVLTQSRHLTSILNNVGNGGHTLESSLWIVPLFHSWNSFCCRGWIWGRDSQRRLDWGSLCSLFCDWRCHLVPRVKPKWALSSVQWRRRKESRAHFCFFPHRYWICCTESKVR